MNKITLFFVVLTVALAAAEISQSDRQRFKQAHDECQADEKTKVREDYMRNAGKSEPTNEPNAAAHTLCMSKKLGLQDAEGKVVKDKVKSRLTILIKDEEELEKAISKCAVDKETPEKTARFIWGCFRKAGGHH